MAAKRRRANRRGSTGGDVSALRPNTNGLAAGKYTPLSASDCAAIDVAARSILTDIGMGDAPEFVTQTITQAGGSISPQGRLLFSARLIDAALDGLCRDFTLHGRAAGQDIRFANHQVHVGTGGAAPLILDLETDEFRDTQLRNIHDAARLINALDNIHFFSRPFVARDIGSDFDLDVNTAFACLSGTTKPIFTSASSPENVDAIADMCFDLAGSKDAFAERPFLSLNINHSVPPLRFHAEACAVMKRSAELGIPFHANTFGQVGASEPVTLAGSLAQTTAETLAGMIFGWCVNKDARITFGARPMVTDLRTGAMTGGGGEQALVMAATTQMAKYYNLPDTCIAGATDAKLADAQSGYEKSLSVTLAAQAGSNAITQAAGSQASLMAASFESYVIDNDMLGAVLRGLSPIEINAETLNLETIAEVANAAGHYLGEAETLNRMHSDFLYPELADRASIEQWQQAGSNDIRNVAKARVREILRSAPNSVLPPEIDERLRHRFDIKLAKGA